MAVLLKKLVKRELYFVTLGQQNMLNWLLLGSCCIVTHTRPCHLQPQLRLLFLLSCFFGWMGDHATFDVLFYLMIAWIYTCRAWYLSTRKTLICALCKRRQVYWDLTHIVVFTGTLIWYHTQTQTAHSGASRLTHPYHIYLHQLLYAHGSYLYYIKRLLSTMSFLFKNY